MKLNLRRKEAHQHHHRLPKCRPKEAQGAQCTKMDHTIKGMEAHLELNGSTLDRGCIEEEREDGSSEHALHNQGVKSLEGTGAVLDQL